MSETRSLSAARRCLLVLRDDSLAERLERGYAYQCLFSAGDLPILRRPGWEPDCLAATDARTDAYTRLIQSKTI
jgi:hypothetical protein